MFLDKGTYIIIGIEKVNEIVQEYFDEKEYRNIQAILEDITKKGTITQDFVVRCCSLKIALVKEILID